MDSILPLRHSQIECFRGILRIDLDIHPNVTVLFGANAVGKTTVLDALAIGLGAIVSRVPKAIGRGFAASGDIRIPWKDRPEVSEKKGIERPWSRVGMMSHSGLAWDVLHWRSAQDRRSKSFGVGAGVGVSRLHEALDPIVKEAIETPLGNLTLPLPFVAAYGTERAVVDVPLRQRDFAKQFHRFQALNRSLHTSTRFKAVFEWFRVMEDEERRERERRRDFNFKLPALEWVRQAVEQAELHCHRPRVETRPLRMLVDFDHGQGETEELDIARLSGGYRTHFALVVDIARRMVQLNPSPALDDPERGTNTRAVVLIDEVDLHLDPPWQGRVVRGLRAAFPNTQFVLTTHSEQVLGSVDAACVRKLVWGDGEIHVEPVPFAQGATGERILIELMGAPERVEGVVTHEIQEYSRLVSSGEGETPSAHELRRHIEQVLPNDPVIRAADSELMRRELAKRFGGTIP